MVETIWCRVDTQLGVQVSFSRYGGTTVSECSAIFLGESGRPRTEQQSDGIDSNLDMVVIDLYPDRDLSKQWSHAFAASSLATTPSVA